MITYNATKILCLANTKYITNSLNNSIDSSIIKEGISAILSISVFDEFIIFPIDIFLEYFSSKLYILFTNVEWTST